MVTSLDQPISLLLTTATNTLLYPKQFPSWRTHCSGSGLPCCRSPLLKVWRTSPSDWRPVCQLMESILKIKC